MEDIPVYRVMTLKPATIGPGDPVSMARQILDSKDIHHLPVVEDGKLAGIVSSADLLKLYLLDERGTGLSGGDVTVSQIMESDPIVLESRAGLRDAATVLSVGGYHAAPVVEPDRTLVGILTTKDLVDHLLNHISRGDSSIRPESNSDAEIDHDDSKINELLKEAEQAMDSGGELNRPLQALLYFRDRNRLLEYACQAAELYIRSGHAEHEHSVLIKRLANLQESKHRVMM